MAHSFIFKFYLNICRKIAITLKMPELSTIERIKENAKVAKDTIGHLKNELNIITNEYNNILARQLREENVRLAVAVEEAKKKLILLECQNGIQQIPVPSEPTTSTYYNLLQKANDESSLSIEGGDPSAPQTEKSTGTKKEKKAKNAQKVAQALTETPIDIGRLDLKIAKIEDVQRHPDADSLYVLKINAGEEHLRTVCSGLVKYVALDDLNGRNVLLLCNLKPVKMRGIVSEAMVMCASSEKGVEVLIPPPDAQPGDLVHCEGYTRQPDTVMNPKKKIFETVAPHLHTNDSLQACYKEVPLVVPGKGAVLSRSLKQVPVK